MSEVAVSIVVATRNRATALALALPYYNLIAADVDWELIVVDNGSSDDTANVIRAFSEMSKIRFSTIREPRAGASRARNIGYRMAAGEIVAFTDDDCYPHKDYVDAIHFSFTTGRIGYLGGRILLFDSNDYPITVQTSLERIIFQPYTFHRAGVMHGANMAVRREVMIEIGGFDERLGAGTAFPCEDIDVFTRASFAGHIGIYDMRPVVYHHHGRSFDQARRLDRYYDRGRGAYYTKGLMTKGLRYKAGRMWLRSVARNLLRGQVRIISHELQGAAHFLASGIPRSIGA